MLIFYRLVDHALARFSTDNLSCMIVRLNKSALVTTTKEPSSAIGVEGDPNSHAGKVSEAQKIVGDARRKVEADGVPGIGISGSNSGKGHVGILLPLVLPSIDSYNRIQKCHQAKRMLPSDSTKSLKRSHLLLKVTPLS